MPWTLFSRSHKSTRSPPYECTIVHNFYLAQLTVRRRDNTTLEEILFFSDRQNEFCELLEKGSPSS